MIRTAPDVAPRAPLRPLSARRVLSLHPIVNTTGMSVSAPWHRSRFSDRGDHWPVLGQWRRSRGNRVRAALGVPRPAAEGSPCKKRACHHRRYLALAFERGRPVARRTGVRGRLARRRPGSTTSAFRNALRSGVGATLRVTRSPYRRIAALSRPRAASISVGYTPTCTPPPPTRAIHFLPFVDGRTPTYRDCVVLRFVRLTMFSSRVANLRFSRRLSSRMPLR